MLNFARGVNAWSDGVLEVTWCHICEVCTSCQDHLAFKYAYVEVELACFAVALDATLHCP
jgi:hypothetical protein